jgi:phosphoserine phosphatase RsbU/P
VTPKYQKILLPLPFQKKGEAGERDFYIVTAKPMSCEQQLAHYKVLMETARCFGRTVDLQTLIDEILDRSKEVMRVEACTLFLPDAKTKELVLHSTDPRLAALPQPLRLPPGKGIAGAVFQSRTPINSKNAEEDGRYFQEIAQKVGVVTRAMLTIPLLDGRACVGVLQALNPREREFFDQQDEEIFEGFGGLIVNALMRLEAAQREIELARATQELLVAREIQESFLPSRTQKFPFCEVRMDYFPAAAVGGDFCCVHRIGERLLLGLGDVTGKGIPAALTMARATAIIKATVGQIQEDLGEWVTALNNQLVQELRAGRFIGITLMLADAVTSSLQVCAAGQFAPLWFDGKQWQSFPMENHLPLGIISDIPFRATTAPLKPGESWLLFSDGIPEARNESQEDFRVSRFQESLVPSLPSAKALESAIASWREFVLSAAQHDDASLLLLDWRGPPPRSDFETLCCPDNLCLGRDFVEQWATYAGFDDVTVGQIVLACDEAATNVFRHSYEQKPGPVNYHAEVDQTHLTIRIEDHAKPIDLTKIKGRELSDFQPGGLGTFIISQVFDEVKYEPLGSGTSLILRKTLP